MCATISRTIVEAHQGSIRLVSTPGLGTTVSVQLPVLDGALRTP